MFIVHQIYKGLYINVYLFANEIVSIFLDPFADKNLAESQNTTSNHLQTIVFLYSRVFN